ncbi:MAG: hypothetical protein ACI9SE_001521 [Neolewinella sp.]|jgi:hypothetical protein
MVTRPKPRSRAASWLVATVANSTSRAANRMAYGLAMAGLSVDIKVVDAGRRASVLSISAPSWPGDSPRVVPHHGHPLRVRVLVRRPFRRKLPTTHWLSEPSNRPVRARVCWAQFPDTAGRHRNDCVPAVCRTDLWAVHERQSGSAVDGSVVGPQSQEIAPGRDQITVQWLRSTASLGHRSCTIVGAGL